MKPKAYFGLAYGLAGCYMPDSHYGAYAVTTRRDMVQAVRDALDFYGMPKACIRQVKWSRTWAHAKRHGLSVVSISINHKGNALSFMGLTEAEYEQWAEAE